MPQLTYKDAGLDLELYEQAMAALPDLMRRTHTPRVMDLPGGFAGLFHMGNRPRFGTNYRDPVLVTGTDGVGTKIKVAAAAGVYNTVGIDLVGMSVNDCLCLGAKPLFFLDYLAIPQDDPELIRQVVAGVCQGCSESGAALLGGETAVMPDLYSAGDFDLAGFCVGVVERRELVDGKRIRPGDVVLGLDSSGFHSNGYSLVRKVVFEHAGLQMNDHVAELGKTVADALLTPTRIYVRPVLESLRHLQGKRAVHGMAHITGGGLADNIERLLPENCRVRLDRKSWQVPALFEWLQRLGNIDREEMFRVFNMGIGFTILVRPQAVDGIRRRLERHGVPARIIGEVTRGERGVESTGG